MEHITSISQFPQTKCGPKNIYEKFSNNNPKNEYAKNLSMQ